MLNKSSKTITLSSIPEAACKGALQIKITMTGKRAKSGSNIGMKMKTKMTTIKRPLFGLEEEVP